MPRSLRGLVLAGALVLAGCSVASKDAQEPVEQLAITKAQLAAMVLPAGRAGDDRRGHQARAGRRRRRQRRGRRQLARPGRHREILAKRRPPQRAQGVLRRRRSRRAQATWRALPRRDRGRAHGGPGLRRPVPAQAARRLRTLPGQAGRRLHALGRRVLQGHRGWRRGRRPPGDNDPGEAEAPPHRGRVPTREDRRGRGGDPARMQRRGARRSRLPSSSTARSSRSWRTSRAAGGSAVGDEDQDTTSATGAAARGDAAPRRTSGKA